MNRLVIAALTTTLLLASCSGAGNGNPGPVEHGDGVVWNSPAVERWAAALGPGGYEAGVEATSFTDPSQALGAATASGSAVVSLGRGGRITVDLQTPIADGGGAEFAVWENGLINQSTGGLFAELAFVEVSSNGTDFARFPAGTSNTSAVGSFGNLDPEQYEGLAGLYPAGTGTAFDLAELAEQDEVVDGSVDLSSVRYLRIVDLVGDGSTLDAAGRPIFDPYPTTGTAGFDLDAVGVLAPQ
mgnify:FL=1